MIGPSDADAPITISVQATAGRTAITLERLRHVGDGQLGAGQVPGDQARQVVADAELAASRRGVAGEELENQDRARRLLGGRLPIDELPRRCAHPGEGLVGDRLDDLEELAGRGSASAGRSWADASRGARRRREWSARATLRRGAAQELGGTWQPDSLRESDALFGLVIRHNDTSLASSPIPMNSLIEVNHTRLPYTRERELNPSSRSWP